MLEESRLRITAIALVIVVVALGVIIEIVRPASQPAIGAGDPIQQVFFCPDTPSGENVDTEIAAVSNEAVQLEGTIEITSDEEGSEPLTVPLTVPPHGRGAVSMSSHTSSAGAATITLPAGRVGVAAKIVRPQGRGSINGVSVYECSPVIRSAWRFAAGSTERGVQLFLYVFNPTDDDVVFSASFVSRDDGEEASRLDMPGQLQGMVLAPHRRVKIPVHEHIIRRTQVATIVDVERGNVVASETLLPAGGVHGFGSTLGSPERSARWFLSGGWDGGQQNETVSVLNETADIGAVNVDGYPDAGTAPIPPKEGIELSATSVTNLDLSGVTDTATPVGLQLVTDPRDFGVNVEQRRFAQNREALVTPAQRPARRWLLPAAPASPTEGFIEMVNPGDGDLVATLYFLSAEGSERPAAVGKPITVPAASRVGIAYGDLGVSTRGGFLVLFDGGGVAAQGLFEQGDWAVTTGTPGG